MIFDTTIEALNAKAKVSDACLVAFSGGKDSLAVLDLCCRTFKRVVAFHMYFVPGLACVEEQMNYARYRWGVPVLYYPHWVFLKCLRAGVFGNEGEAQQGIPEMKLHDIYTWIMADTGIGVIATGARRADSFWRRRYFYLTRHWGEMLYPLKEWMLSDVLAYNRLHDIPLPDSEGKANTGIDLTANSVLWLHDHHPEDFARLEAWFPYVRAVVYRRQFHNIPKPKGR